MQVNFALLEIIYFLILIFFLILRSLYYTSIDVLGIRYMWFVHYVLNLIYSMSRKKISCLTKDLASCNA